MLGRTISHYRISSQLGAGGMGVVYAGEDIRLGRPVALKFVPEDLTKDPTALERLRAEARAASALNHANICTVYDVGEYDGQPFIVMELLKGHTLRDGLTGGPLRIHQIVDIGIQVADALDAAHAQGILHRDIKPANLFLVDRGAVKILDFGLAKHLADGPTGTTVTTVPELLTAEGVTVGTVAYMSPEQVTGEQLDGRTDLFSLGVVLYESVTGHRPFTGKTSAVVLSAILNQSPVAPVVFNPQIPVRLQDVINNCLEKDRELRYQDAAGLRADLKRIRRDLESGHSNALKAVAAASQGEGRATPKSSRPNRRADDVPSKRGFAPSTWFAALAAAVLTLLGSYWFGVRQPATPPPATTVAEVKTPDNAEARQVQPREQERTTTTSFDEAIARGNRLLASGDADGAFAALKTAREIDPGSPAVAELSERIVAQYKTRAGAARSRADQPRVATAAPPPSQPSSDSRPPDPQPPPPAPDVARQRPAAPPVVETQPTVLPPTTASAPEPAPAPPPVQTPSPPEPASPRPEAANQSRAAESIPRPPVEDDDTMIRRVIETWGRAIEAKDLAMYRSVKPNLTAEEQRRIEDGFRAVTSQRVGITILGIDHRGQQVVVRLRRRDTAVADGRQQTSETQATITLVRSGSGWVISEIGR
jgi:serine/threonine protein kinase